MATVLTPRVYPEWCYWRSLYGPHRPPTLVIVAARCYDNPFAIRWALWHVKRVYRFDPEHVREREILVETAKVARKRNLLFILDELKGRKEHSEAIQAAVVGAVDLMDSKKGLLVVELGADPETLGSDGRTLMHAAAGSGSVEDMTALHGLGLEYSVPDTNGQTPLYVACKRAKLSTADFLVKRGADVEKTDSEGRNLAHALAEGTWQEYNDLPAPKDLATMAQWLVEKGVDLNLPDRRGATPLDYVIYSHEDLYEGEYTELAEFIGVLKKLGAKTGKGVQHN